MKGLLAISILIAGLYYAVSPEIDAAEKERLDVLNMQEIPTASYDVQLQTEGRNQTVKLSIKNNRATFVKSSSSTYEGLSGEFAGTESFLRGLA